jgi:protein phosphatase
MPKPTALHWTSFGLSDVGRVRKLNEDSFLDDPHKGVWAVADGMGGHEAGDHASRSVTQAVSKVAAPTSLSQLLRETEDRITEVNLELCDEAQRRQARIIGSTIVLLLAYRTHGVVLWAGDSRAYRLRKGALKRLTRDHSRIEELISKGRVDPEDAAQHPDAAVITRAIGVARNIELDSEMFEIEEHDVYLLCSDGLSRELSDAEITDGLSRGDASDACRTLVARALTKGARDNVTAIVVHATAEDAATQTRLNPIAARETPDHDDDPTMLQPGPDRGRR